MSEIPTARLRTLQIIAGAFTWGVVCCFGIMLYLASQQGFDEPGSSRMISSVAALVLVFNCIANVFLQVILIRAGMNTMVKQDRSLDDEKLLNLRQTTLLVYLALIEGAAFLCCIALLLERQSFVIGLILGAIFIMIWQFPTKGRVERWMDRQRSLLEDVRRNNF